MRIESNEYAARRQRVLDELDGSVGVIFSGEGGPPLLGKWRPDRHFEYLTGLTAEPGAAVLFDPTNPDSTRRTVLFLKPVDPERDHWDGYRDPLGAALRQKTGFTHIARIGGLPAALTTAARRGRKLACLHSLSVYPNAVSADYAAFKSVSERVPGVSIEDRSQLLIQLRSVKSAAELEIIQTACAATTEGYEQVLKILRPGVNEAEVADVLGAIYRKHGGTHAYNPIVGGGNNATVLHYMENDQLLTDGQLVLIDSGAAISGYASDVTRTFPVSGKFSAEQKFLYELVLEAEEAAIAACLPGVALWEVDKVARKVFADAGFPDAYVYTIGHGLGLDVHDALPDGTLQPGMVITIEPGIYLLEKSLGIRIEDDVLITEKNPVNLTKDIPKTVAQIEAMMAG
jgi:Xaa-Pro aminopeptidase